MVNVLQFPSPRVEKNFGVAKIIVYIDLTTLHGTFHSTWVNAAVRGRLARVFVTAPTMSQSLCSRCLALQVRRSSSLHASRRQQQFNVLAILQRNQNRRNGSRRTLSSQTKRAAELQSIATSGASELEIGLMGRDAKLQEESIESGTPRIREHLRAWYKQLDNQMTAETEEHSASSGGKVKDGRIWSLPSSLFMPDPEAQYESEAQEEFVKDFMERVEGGPSHKLTPGELTSLKLQSGPSTGIYLNTVGNQAQFLLPTGQYLQIRYTAPNKDSVPGFASEEELQPIIDLLPKHDIIRSANRASGYELASFTGDLPKHLTDPLVHRMRVLEEEVVLFRRNHAPMLDTLYERLAKDDEYVHMPFVKYVALLLGEDEAHMSFAARVAIFRLMAKSPTKTFLYRTGGARKTLQVLLGPKRLSTQFSNVVEWARAYQELAAAASKGEDVRASLNNNPVNLFINKARRIILKSRKIRSPTTIGCLGPTSVAVSKSTDVVLKPSGEEFSDTDKVILDFIWDTYIRTPRVLTKTSHHAIGSIILRAIGAYPKMILEDKIGRLVLQELGAMAPWAGTADDNVMFPLPERRGSHRATSLQNAAEEATAKLKAMTTPGQPLFEDTMKDLRKDLGSLPVLCIDSIATELVDDGITLEPSSEHPGCHWIHVHIAHASAFISPHSIYGQLARHKQSSWYTAVETHGLLPRDIGLPLGIRSGAATLTTSTLLNDGGEVLDRKVRPTRVHNVVKLASEAVDKLMDRPIPETVTLIVGSDPSVHPVKSKQQIAADHLVHAKPYEKDLRKMYDLLVARTRARRRAQPEYLDHDYRAFTKSEARVSFQEPYRTARLYESIHYEGDPTIYVRAQKYVPIKKWVTLCEKDNMDVVSGCMALAGETAARWLKDRNIPALFEGTLMDPNFPISALNNPTTEFYQTPKVLESQYPVHHVMFNMEAYLKYTSPLRRFRDLLAQWNTDTYLRAEAQGEIEPGSAVKEGALAFPYSSTAIRDFLDTDGWISPEGQSLTSGLSRHWLFHALFRAFHFKEAELPQFWDAEIKGSATTDNINHPDVSNVKGTIHPLCLPATFLKTKERWENQALLRQYLPVRLEMVDVTVGSVLVRAIGPPTATPTYVREGEGDVVWQSKKSRLAEEKLKVAQKKKTKPLNTDAK